MKGEVRRFGRSGDRLVAKREINGNTYFVTVVPVDKPRISHYVSVYANKKDGRNHGFPDGTAPYQLRDNYEYLAGGDVHVTNELAPVISKYVNSAISELTGHLESTKSKEDAVLGALEANHEVHDDG